MHLPVDPVYPCPAHCPYSGTAPVAEGDALADVLVVLELSFEVVVELIVLDFEVDVLVDTVVNVVVVDVYGVLDLTKNATLSCAATVTV